MLVSVYRYNPEVDDKPHMQDYNIELPEGRDLMVLDVLQLIIDQDPTLGYRRSCREGVCGSDGMNMNGVNGLACITPVSRQRPQYLLSTEVFCCGCPKLTARIS